MLGLVERHLNRRSLHLAETRAAARLERGKGQSLQLIQTAEGIQPFAHLLADIPLAADTNLQFSKIWVTDRNIRTQIAGSLAIRTVWIP